MSFSAHAHITSGNFIVGVSTFQGEEHFSVNLYFSKKKGFSEAQKEFTENTGILVASGLVAGEALTGVILAGLYLAHVNLPVISKSPWIGLLVFPILYYMMITIPLQRTKRAA
jgi:hypothetical protein